MPRKIEIELTSTRPDGSWTWRVSGAKQPKGVLDGGLLPAGAKVGDLLRAEAEFELDGTQITSVSPPPGKRPEPERLQLLSDSKPFEGVTTSLVPKTSRPRRDRDDRGPRPDRGDRDRRGPRPDRPGRRPTDGAGAEAAGERAGDADRRPRDAGTRGRPPAGARGDRNATTEEPGGRGRTGTRPATRRPDGRGPGEGGGEAEHGRQRAAAGPGRPKRLTPANTHRNEVLDSLAPEERAVAEQLLHGGIPAVRRAVQEQNARAKEEGRPEVKADALIALAEEILPRLKAAEWRDRAEAAAKDADEIGLRDLRSVVAGADAGARDDESRILAKTLRETLDRREAAARDAWVAEITAHLDEGRIARALRVAGRPPDPRTRFPAELATRLTEAASNAMSPDTSPDRWAALLAAVLESPVRRSVKPVGLPPSPPESLLHAARQASGRVPALAPMLGLQMPPPPGPPRGAPRPPPGRPRSSGAPSPGPTAPVPAAPAPAAPAPPVATVPAAAPPPVATVPAAAPPPVATVPATAPSLGEAPPPAALGTDHGAGGEPGGPVDVATGVVSDAAVAPAAPGAQAGGDEANGTSGEARAEHEHAAMVATVGPEPVDSEPTAHAEPAARESSADAAGAAEPSVEAAPGATEPSVDAGGGASEPTVEASAGEVHVDVGAADVSLGAEQTAPPPGTGPAEPAAGGPDAPSAVWS
jgi:hypothetical protein